jgi:chemotaxis protein histidine kinase CheA
MAEKSATPEDDQSELAFHTGFGDTAPAPETDKVETKPKDEKPEPKPDTKAEAPPKKAEPAKAEEKKPEPVPEHVQITKDQFDKLMAAADETASLKGQMSKAFGTIGNMQQLMNRLQEATPKGGEIKLTRAIVAKLEKEFPELADGQYEAFEQLVRLINESGGKGTGESPATDPAIVSETIRKARLEDLEETYPDWMNIVAAVSDGKFDPKHPFRAWLATQPAEYQQKVNDTNNPRVIERAIDRFKAHEAEQAKTVKKPEPPKPNPQTESRKQLLRETVQPRGAGHEPPQSKTAEDHFKDGFSSG